MEELEKRSRRLRRRSMGPAEVLRAFPRNFRPRARARLFEDEEEHEDDDE
jgi:hypothetical protein